MYFSGSSQIQYCPYIAALPGAEDYPKSGFFKDHGRLTRVSRVILSPFMAAGNKRIETRFIRVIHGFKEFMLPGMILPVFTGQHVGHDVGIAHGAFNAAVTQQLLYMTDTRAVFQQVRCRRVPDRMGRDIGAVHAETTQEVSKPFTHTLRVKMPALRRPTRSGEYPGIPVINLPSQIEYEKIMRYRRYRHDAIPVELAAYHHHAAVEVQITHLQGCRLGDPECGGIDQLKEGAILESLFRSRIDVLEER